MGCGCGKIDCRAYVNGETLEFLATSLVDGDGVCLTLSQLQQILNLGATFNGSDSVFATPDVTINSNDTIRIEFGATTSGQIEVSKLGTVITYKVPQSVVDVNNTQLPTIPTPTGNTTNLNSFVIGADGHVYFIDAQGDAINMFTCVAPDPFDDVLDTVQGFMVHTDNGCRLMTLPQFNGLFADDKNAYIGWTTFGVNTIGTFNGAILFEVPTTDCPNPVYQLAFWNPTYFAPTPIINPVTGIIGYTQLAGITAPDGVELFRVSVVCGSTTMGTTSVYANRPGFSVSHNNTDTTTVTGDGTPGNPIEVNVKTQCEIDSDTNGIKLADSFYDSVNPADVTGAITQADETQAVQEAYILKDGCKIRVFINPFDPCNSGIPQGDIFRPIGLDTNGCLVFAFLPPIARQTLADNGDGTYTIDQTSSFVDPLLTVAAYNNIITWTDVNNVVQSFTFNSLADPSIVGITWVSAGVYTIDPLAFLVGQGSTIDGAMVFEEIIVDSNASTDTTLNTDDQLDNQVPLCIGCLPLNSTGGFHTIQFIDGNGDAPGYFDGTNLDYTNFASIDLSQFGIGWQVVTSNNDIIALLATIGIVAVISGDYLIIDQTYTPPAPLTSIEVDNVIHLKMQPFSTVNNDQGNVLETIGYPVGVFNINDVYLGLANNPTDYINLWNSDPTNNALGTMGLGDTPIDFTLPAGTPLTTEVIGRRFWYVTAVSGIADILVSRKDLVQIGVGGTPMIFSSHPVSFPLTGSYHSGSELPSGYYEYNTGNEQDWAIVRIPSAANELIRVFHNETSYMAGLSDYFFSPSGGVFMDIGGNFPIFVIKLFFKLFGNFVTNNLRMDNPLVLNYNDLTEVEILHYQTSQDGSQGNSNEPITHIPLFLQMKKLKRFNGFVTGAFDNYQINATNFPVLRGISQTFGIFTAVPKDFNNIATLPKITEGLDWRTNGFSAAKVDTIYNDLVIAITGVVPTVGGKLTIQFGNTTATGASAVARAYLAGQGWIVN